MTFFYVFQSLGNSQKEYEKCIVNFSIKNQLRYRGNLVRFVRKDERRYYEDLLAYSRENLMLYPYHLSDVAVKGLRVTPFQYYISMMENIMEHEKSYDSLPNFTAADCKLYFSCRLSLLFSHVSHLHLTESPWYCMVLEESKDTMLLKVSLP
jgi:hypothetical protein